MWFTNQSHENMFRAVCGPNRAETIHNIRHVTISRRLRRRDSLYSAAFDYTSKNISFAPESS